MTNGSNAITDDDGRFQFTQDDVGQPIWVIGATPPIDSSTTDNGMLRTSIATVIDATHATTVDAATGDTSASSNATLFRQRGWPLIGSGNLQFSLTSHDVASFTFLDELPKPEIGQPVLFRISGDDIFGGTIDNIVGQNVPGSPLGKWAIDCVSWDRLAYKRTTGEPTFSSGSPAVTNPQNGLFSNMTVSEIIKFLIVHALGSEGLDFVGAVDGPVIPTFTASYAQSGDAFDQLIKAGSDQTTFLHWFTDPTKKIWLADQSTFTAPWDIDGGNCDGSLLAAVQCTWDRSEFIDRALVRLGNEISDPITESFVGDSSTKAFQMSNPVANTPTITENGTPVSVGILGISTGSAWYWSQGSTAITQDPAGAPLSPSVTLVVIAAEYIAGIVAEENAAAVLERQEVESGTGLYENVIQQDNPATETEGQTLAAAIAGQYGVIPKRIQITTYRPGLKIGQNINVTLAVFGLSAEPFCISDVQITTDDNLILWTVTMVGSPLINWDYRATLATLRPGSGGNGNTGRPNPQMFWRTIDINNTTPGLNIAPNLTVQGTGKGIKIAGVLRKAITANLVVRVNVAGVELGTLTIPSSTHIKTKVETSIATKTLVEGTIMTWDIVSSDSSRDADSIASITVEWGSVTQITIMGQWKGPWDVSGGYALGDTVSFDGSSYISLQDGNTGNSPDDPDSAFWAIVALRGSPGIAGTGVPAGGTTGQVLTKASDADFDTDWETIPEVLTTKGDLETVQFAGSPAANTIVRLPVGADGTVLTADSTQSKGLAWASTKVEVQNTGTSIGTRHAINFIGLGSVTISVVDDPANGRVNVYISVGTGPVSAGVGLWSLIGFGPFVG
jgi:hypothetical protein